MLLLILKNAHSTLEWYEENHTDLQPDINWCVWREPWHRFVSAVWTDVVEKQQLDRPNSDNHSVAEIVPKIMDKDWLRQQVQGDGPEALYYNAGHMITQWNDLQRECHRLKLFNGSVRIYGSVKTATKTHFNIKAPRAINQSPPTVLRKIKDTLSPFKAHIVETYLQQDYEIWEQLDPVLNRTHTPFIDVPVDKIRKDL